MVSVPAFGGSSRAYNPGVSEEGGRTPIPGRSHEWRVRPWIRAAAVLVSVLLAIMASPAMGRVLNPDGLTSSDQAAGYLQAAGSMLATWLLAFRPRVRLDANGIVEVTNPFRTTRFPAQDVSTVAPSLFGVQFALCDRRRVWTIAFQDTWALSGQPRWFDLAEAVTGERPPDPHWDEHDWDEHDDQRPI